MVIHSISKSHGSHSQPSGVEGPLPSLLHQLQTAKSIHWEFRTRKYAQCFVLIFNIRHNTILQNNTPYIAATVPRLASVNQTFGPIITPGRDLQNKRDITIFQPVSLLAGFNYFRLQIHNKNKQYTAPQVLVLSPSCWPQKALDCVCCYRHGNYDRHNASLSNLPNLRQDNVKKYADFMLQLRIRLPMVRTFAWQNHAVPDQRCIQTRHLRPSWYKMKIGRRKTTL